ncbi:Piso0_004560 [Millerozyma farinosa CBS 7064]|uniref:Piso0_004560 protein n=1 Tax=Pichia sorbitophila (strain ATCC MYA-4447 / BCRC 22081 / CBS 7064 / NBRC 10061 / NRRL Y-12695) TaxID=559304 RepID=G8Y949_PICSO|nr:Piso0_004560 [Millerozyma farinosa CBS 7064]CCE84994.1 Piso0_004560 [Millerozyma farinosa CBS 7064]
MSMNDNNGGSKQPFQPPTVQIVEFERVGPMETEFKRPPGAARTRSTSSVSKGKRNHSESITSLGSTGSVEDDDTKYFPKVPEESEMSEKHAYMKPYGPGPKSKHMDDVDLERQIILTAGGRRENVNGFLCKLLILVLAVMGCAVLVFYAL